MNWKCPNGCNITEGVVCGGDYPFWARRKSTQYAKLEGYYNYPNMYILMDLEADELLRISYGGDRGLDLDEVDWLQMYEHAQAHGRMAEPMCPKCLEYLVEES